MLIVDATQPFCTELLKQDSLGLALHFLLPRQLLRQAHEEMRREELRAKRLRREWGAEPIAESWCCGVCLYVFACFVSVALLQGKTQPDDRHDTVREAGNEPVEARRTGCLAVSPAVVCVSTCKN